MNSNETPKGFLNREISLGKTFNDKHKENFYNELSNLLLCGVDIQKALTIIEEEQEKQKIKSVISVLRNKIVQGSSLSNAMKDSDHFTVYEYQCIGIGEETGRIVLVLDQLKGFFGDKVKLRRQMISVFTYPTFVLAITFGVLFFMLNSVVPMFENVFKQFGQELPMLTQKIITLSENFDTYFTIGIILLVLLIGFGYYSRKEIWYREFTSSTVLKIPVFGSLIQKIYLARFCQSMELLMSSKTPLITSIDLVGKMIAFYPIEKSMQEIQKGITAGGTLHQSMSNFSIFDKRLISMIKIAEEINQLDSTFERLTKQYQEEIDFKTKLVGTIIEPMIIILIGSIVGIIMVAMYLPMFNLSNVIK